LAYRNKGLKDTVGESTEGIILIGLTPSSSPLVRGRTGVSPLTKRRIRWVADSIFPKIFSPLKWTLAISPEFKLWVGGEVKRYR